MDVTLAEPEDVAEVTEDNCYNSSDIGFNLVFTTEALRSSATRTFTSPAALLFVALASLAFSLL